MNIKGEGQNGLLIAGYFIHKIIPSLVGALSIYLGYDLFVKGVTGQASLVMEAKSLKAS